MPKKEIISIRILELLNLESEFEISYEEYSRHLKEALIAARLTKSKFSTEEAEILTNEFKRVKNKKGRFTINPKKEKSNQNSNLKSNVSSNKKKKAIAFLTGSKETPIKKDNTKRTFGITIAGPVM